MTRTKLFLKEYRSFAVAFCFVALIASNFELPTTTMPTTTTTTTTTRRSIVVQTTLQQQSRNKRSMSSLQQIQQSNNESDDIKHPATTNITRTSATPTPTVTTTLKSRTEMIPTRAAINTTTRVKGFYVSGRTDRSGAAIFAMLSAHSVAYQTNATFLGACFEGFTTTLRGIKPYMPHRVAQHQQLIQAIGLQDELLFACPPPSATPIVNTINATQQQQQQQEQQQQDLFFRLAPDGGDNPRETMTPAWLNHIRSISRSKIAAVQKSRNNSSNSNSESLQVAVHVRRGDAHPCMSNPHYLPSLYYQDALHVYVPRLVQQYTQQQQQQHKQHQNASKTIHVHVMIYSESFTFEPWDDSWRQRWGEQTVYHEKQKESSPSAAPSSQQQYEVQTELKLDTDEVELWKRFISADLVILSKSLFLTLPALLNSVGTIVTPPFRELSFHLVKQSNFTNNWHMIHPTIYIRAHEELKRLQQQHNCSVPHIRKELLRNWSHVYFGQETKKKKEERHE